MRALRNAFGGQTSVEFLRIGPQHDGGDAGDRQTSRNQNRGRSGDYCAEDSSEANPEDEVKGPSSTPTSPRGRSSALAPSSQAADQDLQGGGRRSLRKSQSLRFGDDEPSGSPSKESNVSSTGQRPSEGQEVERVLSQDVLSEGITSVSSRLSGLFPPRKNSILDNRMQQLKNLRLELAVLRKNHEPQQTKLQMFMLKIEYLLKASLNVRWSAVRRCTRRLASKEFITTPFASSVCSGIIILNALFIGVELELNDDTGFKVKWFLLESGFLAFFILELALRFRAASIRANLKDPWVIFDITMIIPGVMDTWVLQFLYATKHGMPRLTLLRLVRLARVARVLRVIRLIRYFHELILLARGILGAVQALSWSLVLIFMILYVSAVLTTSWYNYMTRVDASILNTATGYRFREWFGSIGASLLTLFQLMTLEGWPEIVRTSMEVWPQAWLFFVPFILLTNVSLLNAITAVVVEKVFSIAQNEAADEVKRYEKQRLNALKKLNTLFLSIDVDSNATLDLEEFREALKDSRVLNILLELGIARYEADELFECLDLDGNQELSVAEFVDGCLRAVGPAQSKHLLQVQYDLLRNFKSLRSKIGDLHTAVRVVLKQLSRVHGVRAVRGKTKDEIQGKKERFANRSSVTEEMKVKTDKYRKTAESGKEEGDENMASAASKASAMLSGASDRKDSIVSGPSKPEASRRPQRDASPSSTRRREKRAMSSGSAVRHSNVQLTGDGPLEKQPSSSATSQDQLPGAVDMQNYKPVGNLLESATGNQQAMNKVLHNLLSEMRDVHGHVSEAMALNWEGNRDKRGQDTPTFRVHTEETVNVLNKDGRSVPTE